MKSVLIALVPLILLTGCGSGPTKPLYNMVAPDTAPIPEKDREPTAKEIEGPSCRYVVEALKDCETTRDQSRELRNHK